MIIQIFFFQIYLYINETLLVIKYGKHEIIFDYFFIFMQSISILYENYFSEQFKKKNISPLL